MAYAKVEIRGSWQYFQNIEVDMDDSQWRFVQETKENFVLLMVCFYCRNKHKVDFLRANNQWFLGHCNGQTMSLRFAKYITDREDDKNTEDALFKCLSEETDQVRRTEQSWWNTYFNKQRLERRREEKFQEQVNEGIWHDFQSGWKIAYLQDQIWWNEFLKEDFDFFYPPSKMELQQRSIEEWKEENRRWHLRRQEMAKKQREYEQQLIGRNSKLTITEAKEIIQRISGFGFGIGPGSTGISSSIVTSDDIWQGKSGPRGCGKGSWDNAIRALEDG